MTPSKKQRVELPSEGSLITPMAVALIIGWALLAIIHYCDKGEFARYAWPWVNSTFIFVPEADALARHAKRLAALAGMTLLLLSSGRRTLRLSGFTFSSLWEELPLSLALGYGLWGTLLLLAGLAGLWSKTLLGAVMAAAFCLAVVDAWRFFRETRSSSEAAPPAPNSLYVYLALAGLVGLFVLRYALIPETFYDALEYHLALPSLYLLHGSIISTPWNSYAGVPSLPQMLNGWTMVLDSWGTTALLLHFSMTAWVGAAMVALARRVGRPLAGLFAAAAFLLCPVVITETFRASVHFEWTLMALSCLMAIFRALGHEQGSIERTRWILLAGTYLGFAMGTKYPAWLMPIPLLLAFHVAPGAKGKRCSAMEIGVVFSVALLWVAPWVAKNIAFYGNPIYPFFNELFVRAPQYVPGWREISEAGTDLPSLFTFNGLWRYLTFPYRFLFPPQAMPYSTGLFCIGLAPILFKARFSEEEKKLGWFCLGAWAPLSLLSSETRFFIPHLPPLILLICCVLTRVQPVSARSILLGAGALLCGVSGLMWITQVSDWDRRAVFLGRKGYGDYLGHAVRSYPSPPYAGIEFLNHESPVNARVLFYGEPRAFYMQRDYIAASPDQVDPLEVWANASSTPQELKERFVDEGIKYVLVNWAENARRHASPKVTQQGLANLKGFWKRYTLRLFGVQDPGDRWLGVYEVLSEEEAAEPHSSDDPFSNR